MTDQNIKFLRPTTPGLSIGGMGESQKQKAINSNKVQHFTAENAPRFNIPKETKYNPLTEKAEPIDSVTWEKEEQESSTQPISAERYEKWKAVQEEKKAARDAARLERVTKQQSLAPELLKKGDLIGAAKALGMTPSDLIALVSSSAMGMKSEVEAKPLSPEEQRAADEKKFRQDRLDFEARVNAWEFNQKASSFIQSNIAPVLADKEKYEMLHATTDINELQSRVYDFVNQHYQDTCSVSNGKKNSDGEVLSISNILDVMEEDAFKAHSASIEAKKNIKKLSKYFGGVPALDGTNEADIARQAQLLDQGDDITNKVSGQSDMLNLINKSRFSNVASQVKPLPDLPDDQDFDMPAAEDDTPDLNISQDKPMILNSSSGLARKDRKWFSLTAQEKLEIIRREDAEKAKSARLKKGKSTTA